MTDDIQHDFDHSDAFHTLLAAASIRAISTLQLYGNYSRPSLGFPLHEGISLL